MIFMILNVINIFFGCYETTHPLLALYRKCMDAGMRVDVNFFINHNIMILNYLIMSFHKFILWK